MVAFTPRELGAIPLPPLTIDERLERLAADFSQHRDLARRRAAAMMSSVTLSDLLIWASHALQAAKAAERRELLGGPPVKPQPDVDYAPGRHPELDSTAASWLCAEVEKRSGIRLTIELLHELAGFAAYGPHVRNRPDLEDRYATFIEKTGGIEVDELLDGLRVAFPIVTKSLPQPGRWSVPMTKERASKILRCDSRQIDVLFPGLMRQVSRQQFRLRLERMDEVVLGRYEKFTVTQESS